MPADGSVVIVLDEHAHKLTERIYAAALDPSVWNEVVAGISEIFGGSPVALGFLLPGDPTLSNRHTIGLADEYQDSYVEHLLKDIPWSVRYMAHFAERFGEMSEVVTDVVLENTGLYRDWLKPQGLAAVWPAGHTLVDPDGEVVGGFTVFRREGEGPFTEDELEHANEFVGHLRRALGIQLSLQSAQHVGGAVAEALDLLPTGLLLLDEGRHVLMQNRGIARIVALKDGFRLDSNGPAAADARENAALQALIADAMEAKQRGDGVSTGFLAVSRPSGKQSFGVMVAPLLKAPGRSFVKGAAVAIFVADPDAGRVHDPEVLAALYSLTHSEAELVRLLAQGRSLEEAAESRGVSVNTARSHLKHVFAKTGTSRQGELVRLVISGVGTIGEE